MTNQLTVQHNVAGADEFIIASGDATVFLHAVTRLITRAHPQGEPNTELQ